MGQRLFGEHDGGVKVPLGQRLFGEHDGRITEEDQ